ncbi:MAG: polysaccharide biosynthesis/export family protein [Pseudomonadota bacterium]
MKRLWLVGFVWIAVISLANCASGGGTIGDFESVGDQMPIPDSTTSVAPGDLRVGALDLVEVEVFGVESLNGTYQVSFDGSIKLPLIGEINVVGMTPQELSYELEKLYGTRYLEDPDVSVSISESQGRRITLDGAIRSPGLYPITGNISLVQAVALGGGLSGSANPRKVVVFRQINGERHAAAFDLVSIRNGDSDDPDVYGNDVIVVDGSNIGESYDRIIRSIPLVALFLAL